MSRHVDGFVLPVPNDEIGTYRDLATKAGELWIEHGTLAYF